MRVIKQVPRPLMRYLHDSSEIEPGSTGGVRQRIAAADRRRQIVAAGM
jgi:hypothetical protein